MQRKQHWMTERFSEKLKLRGQCIGQEKEIYQEERGKAKKTSRDTSTKALETGLWVLVLRVIRSY